MPSCSRASAAPAAGRCRRGWTGESGSCRTARSLRLVARALDDADQRAERRQVRRQRRQPVVDRHSMQSPAFARRISGSTALPVLSWIGQDALPTPSPRCVLARATAAARLDVARVHVQHRRRVVQCTGLGCPGCRPACRPRASARRRRAGRDPAERSSAGNGGQQVVARIAITSRFTSGAAAGQTPAKSRRFATRSAHVVLLGSTNRSPRCASYVRSSPHVPLHQPSIDESTLYI